MLDKKEIILGFLVLARSFILHTLVMDFFFLIPDLSIPFSFSEGENGLISTYRRIPSLYDISKMAACPVPVIPSFQSVLRLKIW